MRIIGLSLLSALVLTFTAACNPSNDTQTPAASPIASPTVTESAAPTPTQTAEQRVSPTPESGPSLTQTATPANSPALQNKPAILQGVDFTAIDTHAENAPESAANSVNSLVSYLIQPAQNDIEKARAIYTWIATHISYDVQGYLSHNYGGGSSDDVLASRTAVCEGYSSLFGILGKAAGLDVVTISGWAKGLGYTVGTPITGPSDHAWNAVRINGKWYLIDSTWGAGSVDSGMNFVKKFTDYYFFTPPDQFIYRHLPEDPDWQILDTPVSKTAYENMPFLEPLFFTSGMQLISHKECTISTGKDLLVTLGAPSDIILKASLEQGSNKLDEALSFTQRAENDVYQIRSVFPAPGNYTLWIFAKNKADTGNLLGSIIQYKVTAAEGSSGCPGFPRTFVDFQSHHACLVSPMTGNLVHGCSYDFEISVPGAGDVAIIFNDNWTHLTREGQIFRCNYTVQVPGELGIYASFPDTGLLYKGLLVYQCQ